MAVEEGLGEGHTELYWVLFILFIYIFFFKRSVTLAAQYNSSTCDLFHMMVTL